MGLFDQLKKEAKDLAGKASQAATRAQIGLEIDALQQRMDQMLIKAGRIAVQLQRSRRIADSSLNELSKDLAPLESRLAALRAERDGAPLAPPAAVVPSGSGIPARQGPVCPNCKQAVEMEHVFCRNCGEKLSACAGCGIIVLATDKTCPACGSQLPQ